jgi:hypothetical protein
MFTLAQVGERFGIGDELSAFAAKNAVAMDTPVWLPGCLMSYRDLPVDDGMPLPMSTASPAARPTTTAI